MIEDEVGKYRKKSTARGQPRSKHKHIYETVLLVRHYETTDVKTGKPKQHETKHPTKVCTICGRIDNIDCDEKWYDKTAHQNLKYVYFCKELSAEALKLPVWHCSSYLDKFATPEGGFKNDEF